MDTQKIRDQSYGQTERFSIIDTWGISLSERRVKKYFNARKSNEMVLLDLGCGYRARLLTRLAPLVLTGYGVDVKVHESVKAIRNVKVVEGPIENALPAFADSFFDCILVISVLEHLEDPLGALKECRRILKDGGMLLINIPTWRGKAFLELSAFRFNLSPKSEIDDHKMYYDKRDLWPLLVRAGFKPSMIEMRYYKFGLNLFAACKR